MTDAAEEAKKEFSWSIRIQRLCAATVRRYFNPSITKAEAEKTTKADALDYIETAIKHCEEWIANERKWETMTETDEAQARQAIAEIAEELRKQAETL